MVLIVKESGGSKCEGVWVVLRVKRSEWFS